MSWCDFTAGWWYGYTVFALGHPLETVKVQMQIFGNRGLLATAKHVYELQGFRGFYRGILVSSLHSAVNHSVSICLYERLHLLNKGHSHGDQGVLGCCEHGTKTHFLHSQLFACGMASGLTTVALSCPIELIKTRQQITGINENISPMQSFKNVYNARGRHSLKNFYVGIAPMCLRDGPAFGSFVIVQEHLECALRQNFKLPCESSNWVAFVSGGFAGVSYLFAGIPFDVVKSRMMTDRLDRPVYRGMMHCFRKTWKEYGLKIFFHSGLPAFVRAFLVNSAGMVVFENVRAECLKNATFF